MFGGSISTTTDFAVAAGLCNIGEASKVLHLDNCLVDAVMISCREILEYCIDHVKVCKLINRYIIMNNLSMQNTS